MQATLERLRERRESGDEGGFTLIELLIVIVILGILAAIVVFAVQSLTGQSANAACQSDYKTVEVAAEAYKAQVGSYPTDITTLTQAQGSVGPWLKEAPSSSHYNLAFGSPVDPSAAGAKGYQSGVIVVTPTGGTATPAPTATPFTAGLSASDACAGVTS